MLERFEGLAAPLGLKEAVGLLHVESPRLAKGLGVLNLLERFVVLTNQSEASNIINSRIEIVGILRDELAEEGKGLLGFLEVVEENGRFGALQERFLPIYGDVYQLSSTFFNKMYIIE